MRPHPAMPGDVGQSAEIDSMIRVDHAGEFAAVQIYRGQRAVFERSSATARTAEIVAEMEAGEHEHLETFDRLIRERGVRPTIMAPVWRAAAFGLGAATALMGEKAAHACTEAVEDVIEKHYAKQSAQLAQSGAEPELRETIERFRADEMGHHDKAVEEGAREAPAYPLLSAVIKLGCRAAIRISERI